MTKKEFTLRIFNSKTDILQELLDILQEKKVRFCVIGGLAVNAYAEPVVSLDLDIIIDSLHLENFLDILPKCFKVKKFQNSINISRRGSDLRIQVQTDPRYQCFLDRAQKRSVLGYKLPVAQIEDVLRGKIWAAQDKTRRASKRQKDLADILRLLETKKSLRALIPRILMRKLPR